MSPPSNKKEKDVKVKLEPKKTAYWNKESTLALAREYSFHPCLYQVYSTHYHNKSMKKKAEESILKAMQKLMPDITIHDCRSRFANLKCKFKKDLDQLAATPPTSFKPKLWCFDKVMFLKESFPSKCTKSGENNKENVSSDNENCLDYLKLEYNNTNNVNSTVQYENISEAATPSPEVSNLTETTRSPLKRTQSSVENANNDSPSIRCMKRLKWRAFGDYIALKMELLDNRQSNVAMVLEHNVLYSLQEAEKSAFFS